MLIDQLPEIVKQAAQGLSGANLTVLNGADGLSEIATGLVGQGLAIFDSLRGGLGQHTSGDGSEQIELNPPHNDQPCSPDRLCSRDRRAAAVRLATAGLWCRYRRHHVRSPLGRRHSGRVWTARC